MAGSIDNHGLSDFAGLVHRGDGEWLHGFAGNLGRTNSLHDELVALLHGLTIAWDKAYRNVTYYSDSKNSLHLIKATSVEWPPTPRV